MSGMSYSALFLANTDSDFMTGQVWSSMAGELGTREGGSVTGTASDRLPMSFERRGCWIARQLDFCKRSAPIDFTSSHGGNLI